MSKMLAGMWVLLSQSGDGGGGTPPQSCTHHRLMRRKKERRAGELAASFHEEVERYQCEGCGGYVP